MTPAGGSNAWRTIGWIPQKAGLRVPVFQTDS